MVASLSSKSIRGTAINDFRGCRGGAVVILSLIKAIVRFKFIIM